MYGGMCVYMHIYIYVSSLGFNGRVRAFGGGILNICQDIGSVVNCKVKNEK